MLKSAQMRRIAPHFLRRALSTNESWSNYLDRVVLGPYIPTSEIIGRRMLSLAETGEKDSFLDLGCGDGRLLTLAVTDFGVKEAVGVELDEKTFQLAHSNIIRRLPILSQREKVKLLQQDALQSQDQINQADVIALYLSGEGLEMLRPVLESHVRKGARIVTSEFQIPQWTPSAVQAIMDMEIYLYQR